jgi:hypothetical protein
MQVDFEQTVDMCVLMANGKKTIKDAMIHLSYDFTHCSDPKVEMKESKHGRGVFALKDIKKGETATVYPAHLIIERSKDGMATAEGRCDFDRSYTFDLSDTIIHQGDSLCANPNFLGHLINDFYPDVSELKPTGESVVKYLMHMISSCNVKFARPKKHFVYIEAIKDIKAGEELLIAYSPAYWTTLENNDETMEVLRLYLEGLQYTDRKKHTFLSNFFMKHGDFINGF